MQTGSSETLIGWKSGNGTELRERGYGLRRKKTTRKAYLAVCLSEGQLGTRHVYQPAILQSAPPRYRRLSVKFSDTRVRTSASFDS
jgi:hypothetical protein